LAIVEIGKNFEEKVESVSHENANDHAFEVRGVEEPVKEEDEPVYRTSYQMR
jgi:hypothetical protein